VAGGKGDNKERLQAIAEQGGEVFLLGLIKKAKRDKIQDGREGE